MTAGAQHPVGFGVATELPDMDFETYSEAGFTLDPVTGEVLGTGPQHKGGLKVVGTPVYAEHPSTEILCLYYDLKDGRGRRAWFPGTPDPVDLIQHIAAIEPIEAHNVTFEFWIWNMICTRRYGWPPLQLEQCYCSMAKARRYSLPGALGKLAPVLGTAQKDKRGGQLLNLLSRPNTQTKNRPYFRRTPVTDWPLFPELYAYCEQDIVAEAEASARMPDLTPYERRTWLADQAINARGVRVDLDALNACMDVLQQAERRYTLELSTVTDGAVGSVSEVARITSWLSSQGLALPNLKAETVEETLERNDLAPQCRRVLEIRAILGGANVKKLYTLSRSVSSDGRLRDQYSYCGASQTGRASAGGVQLQNITSKGPDSKDCNRCGRIVGAAATSCPACGATMFTDRADWTVEAVEWAIRDILTRDLDAIMAIWGDPADLLAGCLRGLFVARSSHDFVCVDFSAIEAVVAACVSRCQWRIEVFSGDGKIYEASAAKATGTPLETILQYKKDHGHHHPARKTIGKVRELAGGYGGWIGAWKNFGADEFMTDEEIKVDVLKWREESPEIVEMWGGQFKWCGPGKWDYRPELFGLEGAAIQAILSPGQWFGHIDIGYIVHEDVLFCRLPSGRFIHYHRPRLDNAEDKLRRGPAWQVTFEGYNSNAQKGPVGWHRMETYGGRLFENCIAEGTQVLTGRGWVAIQDVRKDDTVHDGVEFVNHGGGLYKSVQACVMVDGVHMTKDHEVLTNDGWKAASQHPRPYRPEIRDVDGGRALAYRRAEMALAVPLRVWRHLRKSVVGSYQRRKEGAAGQLWVHDKATHGRSAHVPRNEPSPSLRSVPLDARPVLSALASSVGELRRAGYSGLRVMAGVFPEFLGGHGADVPPWRPTGQTQQLRGVLTGKLPLGTRDGKCEQQAEQRRDLHGNGSNDGSASLPKVRHRQNNDTLPAGEQLADRPATDQARLPQARKKVYDILNAGPRHRFVVLGRGGPFIVHNCVQAIAADIQFEAVVRLEESGYPVVMHTHDEAVAEVPEGYGSIEEMEAIMSQRPEWATWWPIRAAGWRHKRYQKD